MPEDLTPAEALANAIGEAIEQFEAEHGLELDQLDVAQALTLIQFTTLFPEDEADIGAGV